MCTIVCVRERRERGGVRVGVVENVVEDVIVMVE